MQTQNAAALADKIWVLVGTRPEVIKQIPVYWALQRQYGKDGVALVGTGQHRELLDQSLRHFGVSLDFNLNVMRPGSSLSTLAARIAVEFGALIQQARPSMDLVQEPFGRS
jgi:UDP-N-acetylglucosamine 2-epimerase (non-hydrolysing)